MRLGAEEGQPSAAEALPLQWPAEKRPLWRRPEDLVVLGALALAVGLGIWLTAGAWGARPPNGEDVMPHLVRARFAQSHLVSHARVDGWEPSFILGYQEFLFIGPAFTWAVVGVHWLSLGLLSLAGAFKVVVIGSFVALPLTVAFLARSIGLDRRAATLAAVLTLAVNNPYGGVGLQGLFNVGLVTHQFGALFFFLSLGGAIRLLREPTRRWAVLTAVSKAGLLMSHGISVMVFAVVMILVVLILASATQLPNRTSEGFDSAVQREVRAELRRLGVLRGDETGRPPVPAGDSPGRVFVRGLVLLTVSVVIAFALAACVLLPFAAHNDLRGTLTGWSTPALGARLAQIWRGQILFRPGVAALMSVGFVYAAIRAAKGEARALLLVVLPIGFIVIAHAVLHEWPSNVVSLQLPNRGLGYAGAQAVLPLAYLLARSARPFGWAGHVAAWARPATWPSRWATPSPSSGRRRRSSHDSSPTEPAS